MSETADVQPRPSVADGPETGALLDSRYLLQHVVGAGGFSTVYAAHDRHINGPVAVKWLRAWCGEHEHRRFLVEIMISGRLSHPHVVRITDRGEHKGQPYAVMPLLAGRTLHERRGEHWRTVAGYMRQYLEGMRALHEASAFVDTAHRTRVLHRDIKPANCIVSEAGHLTIIDLGVIKPLDQPVRATTAGTLVGSVAYMAPECLFLVEPASERSDVYSLGVTFFEMLTGDLPYLGRNVEALRAQLLGDRPPPSARALRPEIPAALAELVQRAMAPLPANRPQTVAAMLAALDPILTRSASGVPRLDRPAEGGPTFARVPAAAHAAAEPAGPPPAPAPRIVVAAAPAERIEPPLADPPRRRFHVAAAVVASSILGSTLALAAIYLGARSSGTPPSDLASRPPDESTPPAEARGQTVAGLSKPTLEPDVTDMENALARVEGSLLACARESGHGITVELAVDASATRLSSITVWPASANVDRCVRDVLEPLRFLSRPSRATLLTEYRP